MARKYKCYGECNERYDKSLMINHKGKNYCKSCLDKLLKERRDREELIEIINKLYGVSHPNGLMLKQIKEFREERGYTYKGMTLTLLYCSKLPGISFKTFSGIGIIPHQYERAKAEFNEKRRREENFVDIDIKPVIIKISKLESENLLKKEKLINLEDLLND